MAEVVNLKKVRQQKRRDERRRTPKVMPPWLPWVVLVAVAIVIVFVFQRR